MKIKRGKFKTGGKGMLTQSGRGNISHIQGGGVGTSHLEVGQKRSRGVSRL